MTRKYSYSSIDKYNNCPRQYKFDKIEKVTVAKKLTADLILGNAVHKTLESLYRTKLNGRVMPLEELIDTYNRRWEESDKSKIVVVRESDSIEDFIETGRIGLKKFYDKYAPFDDGQSLIIEQFVDFPLDPNERFHITGKIDRLARHDDGIVEIIDYKTQAMLPTQIELDNNHQMALYLMAVRHLWPDFKTVRARQVFIRHGLEMTANIDDNRLEEIRYAIYQNILEIEDAAKNDNFPPKESGLCNWCEYFNLCPAKRHQMALEGNQDEQFDEKVGEKLAEQYIRLDKDIKSKTAELKALKEDIIQFCEESDLTKLYSADGEVNVRFSESEEFPSKTANSDAFLNLSILARDAGLDEVFKLDQNVLYKEFYRADKLPPELKEKMGVFLVKRKSARVTTKAAADDEETQ